MAGGARSARWARRRIETAHREFVRRTWKRFVVVAGFVGGLALVAWFWFPLGERWGAFAAGALVALGLAGLRHVVVSSTGTMAQLSGIDAEAWTAAELRRSQRKGWAVLQGLPLDRADVDHIAIGRGHVLVLETKWSSKAWDVQGSDHRVADAAAQARHGAGRVRILLQTLGVAAPVRGVVVLWGPLAQDLRGHHVDTSGERVAIVHGSDLRAFLDTVRSRDGLDHEHVWERLATEIEKRDAFHAKRNPEPVRWEQRAAHLFVGVAGGLAASLVLISLVVDVFGQRSNVGALLVAIGLCGLGAGAWIVWRRYPLGLATVGLGAAFGLIPVLILLALAVGRALV